MKVGDSSPIFIRLYCIRKSNDQGNTVTNRGYRAYGNYRSGGTLPTDHQFTGQKQDGTGLLYYRSRYFDPVIGAFISPDTIVPDAGLVSDDNRYMMTRGNPLKYSDPSGHFANEELEGWFGPNWRDLFDDPP